MWRSTIGKLDAGRLVFVDEMGTHTSLASLYAYSPRGKRAFFKVPRNRGKNTTFCSTPCADLQRFSQWIQWHRTRSARPVESDQLGWPATEVLQ